MKFVFAALLSIVTMGTPASAQNGPEVADHWRALARIDGRAALALIRENHPGAQPVLHDTVFLENLDRAQRHLEERLAQVTNYDGYNAVMEGLAADFRDGHIWSQSLAKPRSRTWTGMVVVREAGSWVIASQMPAPGKKADLVGARIVSCDGMDADAWAKSRIGMFQADPGIEARLASSASWLLIDENNPFLKRPERCVFQRDGAAAQDVELFWGRTSTDMVDAAIEKSGGPASVGLGVESFGKGYWISLGTLRPEANDLIAKVEGQKQALRRAPIVVVDLRGNGGGDSSFADRLATALVGERRMAAASFASSPCSGAYWRASPGNIESRLNRRAQVAASSSREALAHYDETTQQMEAAVHSGQAFVPALPACASHAKPPSKAQPKKLPPSLLAGKLVIVTDRACFSSCLLAVDAFRRIGATQVGEATDMSTRYMEVRTTVLPSGLRNFSTLQKVAVGAGDFGPYAPDRPFKGKMSDTAALRNWIAHDFAE